MSTFILTQLAAEYRVWSAKMVERVRFANELDGMTDADVDRASAAILEARLRRDNAAEKYIEESEKLRSKQCGHPIEANIVACSECCRVSGYVAPEVRKLTATRGGR
jgi:hypothetical protein